MYSLLADNVRTHIWLIKDKTTYKIANKYHASFFGKRTEDFGNLNIYRLLNEEEAETAVKNNELAFQSGKELKFEEWITNVNGQKRLLYITRVPVANANGNVHCLVCHAEDITEIRQQEESIRYKAFHDSITGFYNRTYFDEQMELYNKDLSRFMPFSIISIDLDGLKIVNDLLGHSAGDEIIFKASQLISSVFRKTDIIARVGGDEFCVLLPKVPISVALEKKNDILRSIDEYNRNNPAVPLSMAVGLYTSENIYESIYSIYKKADEDMYSCKMSKSSCLNGKAIDILMNSLAERDNAAYGHIDRLGRLAEAMALRIGLRDWEMNNMRLFSKLHDIGKVSISDDILFKPGNLSEEEFNKMKEHSIIGYNIALRCKEFAHIAYFIKHHHEAWNGKGYPEGLDGEQIPIECRILSVIDAFDVMTNNRIYSKPKNKFEALREIRRCAGTQFDPNIAENFINVVEMNE